MSESFQVGIERILVAFDTSCHSGSMLETASELAANLQAELHGLFFEDENLFRLAGMPFACEIGGTSASQRPLSLDVIERSFRASAEKARRALIATAERARVGWAFEVCRGQLRTMTLAATDDADITIIGPRCSTLELPFSDRKFGRCNPTSSSDRLASQNKQTKQIIVLMDGSTCAFRAVQIAMLASRAAATDLIVFLVPRIGVCFEELRVETDQIIRGQPRSFRLNVEFITSEESLIHRLNVGKHRLRLALLSRNHLITEERSIQLVIQRLHCPLALVR